MQQLDLTRIRKDSWTHDSLPTQENPDTLGHSESSIAYELRKWKHFFESSAPKSESDVKNFVSLASNTLKKYPNLWKNDFVNVTGEILRDLRKRSGIIDPFLEESISLPPQKQHRKWSCPKVSCFRIIPIIQINMRRLDCTRKKSQKNGAVMINRLDQKDEFSIKTLIFNLLGWVIVFSSCYLPWILITFIFLGQEIRIFTGLFDETAVIEVRTTSLPLNDTEALLYSDYCYDIFRFLFFSVILLILVSFANIFLIIRKNLRKRRTRINNPGDNVIQEKSPLLILNIQKYLTIDRIGWLLSFISVAFNFWGLVLIWIPNANQEACRSEVKVAYGVVGVFFAMPLLCIITRAFFLVD